MFLQKDRLTLFVNIVEHLKTTTTKKGFALSIAYILNLW